MTLVAALRNKARIVVMSDMAISNRSLARSNSVPGRLKSIVLSTTLTVSYAGNSERALDVIRLISQRSYSAQAAIDELASYASINAGDVEFLVCSHEHPDSPRLVKISDLDVYEGADFYWIGNSESARALSNLDSRYIQPVNPPDFQSAEEREFVHRFVEYVNAGGDPKTGGMAVNCLCSEYGHCYQGHAGIYHWDTVTIPDPTPAEVKAAFHKTGHSSFSYHVYSPAARGVAIVGVYFEQPGVGYIHLPLKQDDPLHVAASSQGEFLKVLNAVSPRL